MRLALALAAMLALAVATPDTTAAHAWDGRYSVYRSGSFSGQVNNYTCVGASVQMMLNVIHQRSDQWASNQKMYWRYAQRHSRYPVTDNGADPKGWALALRHWNGGYYTVAKAASVQASLRTAARRMRLTGKPVGLLVHRGGHAWVMTGFAATADPARTNDYRVTAVQAMGPLWPSGTINGSPYDPGPKTWIRTRDLKQKFTPYRQPYSAAWNGLLITVVP
ncbi:MAG TPA: hypothetical protein VK992_01940 [Candidatus Caenarcaniphilales bacterium]|nr:hypothetical protein [Candidatus Caenarcaniphilales bacterium]